MDREYVHTYWDPGTFDNRFIVEHMRDKYVKACQEIGIPSKPINTDYYILPKYIYENVPSCEKDIDYLFVGNMVFIGMYPHKGVKNRRWVIEFAKNLSDHVVLVDYKQLAELRRQKTAMEGYPFNPNFLYLGLALVFIPGILLIAKRHY